MGIGISAVVRELYPWLVLFLALDCTTVARASSWLLFNLGGELWRLRGSTLHFIGPLPWARALLVDVPGVGFAREGLVLVPPAPAGKFRCDSGEVSFLPYDDIARIERNGREVRLGTCVLPTCSAAAALVLERRVRHLRDADPARREISVRRLLARSLSVARFRRVQALAESAARGVALLNAFFFLAVFVLPPVYLVAPVPQSVAVAHALLAALLVPAIGLASFRLHRRLFPNLRGDRWSLLATTLLFPVSAAHTAKVVLRDLGAGFDWGTAVAACLPAEVAAQHVAAESIRLHLIGEEESNPVLRRFWKMRLEAVLALAATEGFPAGYPGNPPARSEARTDHWCPLCREGFQARTGLCPDCLVPLIPFAPQAENRLGKAPAANRSELP
jgi:hypothetical protein